LSINESSLDVRKLTIKTLESLLESANPKVVLESFEIISRAACGDGIASTADRITLKVKYKNNPNKLPEILVFKTLLLNPLLRLGLPSILFLSTAVNSLEKIQLLGDSASRILFLIVGSFQKYFPQAPDAMYQIESRCDKEIRTELNIEAPKIFAARYDKKSRQFAILMEDLTLRDVIFPNATDSQDLDTEKSTIKQLALIHAKYWQSEELITNLNWVPRRLEGGKFPLFNGIGFDLIQYQVDKKKFNKKLNQPYQQNRQRALGCYMEISSIIIDWISNIAAR